MGVRPDSPSSNDSFMLRRVSTRLVLVAVELGST